MADDHNEDPPNEVPAAFSNSESSNDELEGNNEPAENAQETVQGTDVEAIVAQENAVASLQRSTWFREPAVMGAHGMHDQQQDREDTGYEGKDMTDSTQGADDLLYLKHTILDYETARKLEHMKSKILSRIELKSPSGNKQKALQIQESEATSNGAAQGRSLPRELQFQQGGGGMFYGNYAPPDLPPVPSLQNLIQDCSKPFEKQLTHSDVSKTQHRLYLNKDDVENYIKPVLRNNENPNEGIDVTTYDMDGNEYTMKFRNWGTNLYVLSGWKTFCHDLGLVHTQDFLTLWVFRHASNGGLCFAIDSRRLPVFTTIKKRKQIRQN